MGKNAQYTADQMIVFGDPLAVAMGLLKERGYRVTRTREELKQVAIDEGFIIADPVIVNSNITNIPELRSYFNKKVWSKSYDHQTHWMEGNIEQELRAFRLFVEAREESGLNRFNAIQQCVAIIDTIFEHVDEFHFNRPIDIRIVGQGKAGWITQKALLIMNDIDQKQKESEFKDRVAQIELEEEEKVDLDKTASALDRMLAKIESNER